MPIAVCSNSEFACARSARFRTGALVFIWLCLTVASVTAQNVGSVVGTVRDHTGAVIAKAEVAATNDQTTIHYETTTNSLGDYAFSNLPQGVYTFTFSSLAMPVCIACPRSP